MQRERIDPEIVERRIYFAEWLVKKLRKADLASEDKAAREARGHVAVGMLHKAFRDECSVSRTTPRATVSPECGAFCASLVSSETSATSRARPSLQVPAQQTPSTDVERRVRFGPPVPLRTLSSTGAAANSSSSESPSSGDMPSPQVTWAVPEGALSPPLPQSPRRQAPTPPRPERPPSGPHQPRRPISTSLTATGPSSRAVGSPRNRNLTPTPTQKKKRPKVILSPSSCDTLMLDVESFLGSPCEMGMQC